MALFAALPHIPRPPDIERANRAATRISDVDTSHVVPLSQLPELPGGVTSQRTIDADYRPAAERHADPADALEDTPAPALAPVVPAPAPVRADTPAPLPAPEGLGPIPAGYDLIARFPLISITGGKFNSRGELDITFRIAAEDVERALPLWRKRRDGFMFYIDAHALPFDDLANFVP